MELSRIKTVSDENIDRIIEENLYRGHVVYGQRKVIVQCMDKDITVTFDFVEEWATIETISWRREVPIESYAPKLMMSKIVKATC